MPRISKPCKLPNGLEVYHLGEENLAVVYDEVFLEDQYLRHGIELKDGDCIFDVGANIGLFMLRINQLLGRGRIFCFEPIDEIFRVLEKNAERHNRLDLQLFNCGLSNRSGSATFTFYPRSAADSSMYAAADSESMRTQQRDYILRVLHGNTNIRLGWASRFGLFLLPGFAKRYLAERIRRHYLMPRRVQCILRSLSEVIGEQGVERIDLLKIDAEFAEFDILAGLTAKDWPVIRQIVMEVHGGAKCAARMREMLIEANFLLHIESDPVRPNNFLFYARACGQ
jgi:FkbM family methyltransferase